MPDPLSAKQAELPSHHGSADLSERADQYVERELLTVENERLRREVAALRSALKAAGKVIGPYMEPHDGARRR